MDRDPAREIRALDWISRDHSPANVTGQDNAPGCTGAGGIV